MMRNLKISVLSLILSATLIHADASVKNSFESDPVFKDFQKLQEDMNRVFENFHKQFFTDIKMPTIKDKELSKVLKTDLNDKGDHYEIKADLPGVDENVIKVTIKDNLLSIDAKTEKREEKEDNGKIIRQERFVGAYHRSMTIPSDANANKMKTDYKNGVLTITIPKK